MKEDYNILDNEFTMQQDITYAAASKGKRFLNALIDILGSFLFIMFGLMTLFLVGLADPNSNEDDPFLTVMVYVLYCLYYLVVETVTAGKTLGKKMTKTRVVALDGSPATFNQIVKRSLARFIPFEALTFFGDSGLHDRLSKTMVIDEQKIDSFKDENHQVNPDSEW